ncbi:Protein of unknown function [Carboxydocella sporoproducens DSM 16521]|uniref:DUF3243 domain-containing protein n=2 Tax=Carboxydocella TaxID=178898 RepID=A0A1T4QPY9_9FIRM|nr:MULTISPECIES: DUF3243 domain-containing protein [Carboxydocella]AVX21535.1 Protein of unknown function (DUF3243) [Carboxydocella thermautotrophica]AVX32016.1 Protein of unknown function (DUF3243) [Carboxydocella thermautotrophica]SKA05756.1 Protein of unknown function [Carboxydocella sporoproducens DSM 16521]
MTPQMTSDWEQWKQTLHSLVDLGERVGLEEETISKAAYKLGNFLADKVDPKNREQRLLKELWDAGDEEERKVLAHLIIKMVNRDNVAQH